MEFKNQLAILKKTSASERKILLRLQSHPNIVHVIASTQLPTYSILLESYVNVTIPQTEAEIELWTNTLLQVNVTLSFY